MIYSILNRSIIISLFAISLSQAMEVEKSTALRINPKDIDATNTISFQGGAFRGFAPYKIIDMEALKGRGNQETQQLDLSSPFELREFKYIFDKNVIEAVFTSFPNLTSLDLSNNNISPLAMEYLLDQLKSNTKLETLKLANSGFCKAGPLFRTTIDFPEQPKTPQPSPTKVIITDDDFAMDVENSGASESQYKEGDDFLTAMKANANPETLPTYHLDGSINTENLDAHFLQVLLTQNTSLKELDLSNNAIRDKHLELISSGFGANKTLQTLNLDGNHITRVGKEKIKQLLIDQNSSLFLSIEEPKTDGSGENGEGCILF